MDPLWISIYIRVAANIPGTRKGNWEAAFETIFKGEGGGASDYYYFFFLLGGGREITISASREGEAATPMLGVRGEEGGAIDYYYFFFLWGGGGR